jgi:hypothetical protein
MAQPIQIILMRQLAGYLNVPLFLVGPNGDCEIQWNADTDSSARRTAIR